MHAHTSAGAQRAENRRRGFAATVALVGAAGLVIAGAAPGYAEAGETDESPSSAVAERGATTGAEAAENSETSEASDVAETSESAGDAAEPEREDAETADAAAKTAETAETADTDADAVPEDISAAVTASGWPEGTLFAGETFTVTISVDSGLLGAPALEGLQVGLASADGPVAIEALDADGTAEVTLRPITVDTYELTPFFAGEEGVYLPVEGDAHAVAVSPTPVTLSLDLDSSDSTDGSVYGGSRDILYAQVKTECSTMDDAAVAACRAEFGDPDGTLELWQDDELIDAAEVTGSTLDSPFADESFDLSAGDDADGFGIFEFDVPDIMLGSPETLDYELRFIPDNWFAQDTTALTAALSPADVDIDIDIYDENLADLHRVTAQAIDILVDVRSNAPVLEPAALQGTVTVFADGEVIAEDLELLDGAIAGFTWTPPAGGDYVLTAEFIPDTLNYTGATSSEYALTVEDAPTPDHDSKGSDVKPAAKKTAALATTGSDDGQGLAFGAAALILMAAGTTGLVLARRRRSS